ncbi:MULTISPECIES: hypothetical protein [Herbaspirillum]|uniref:hypothetical protein n=1 Tax=Herbaspirillum TaxID=963 RepID=UPI0015855952|nr:MULTISPECIES: hypothetical protein [Herbaspirillum]NUT60845.1 hypothetical protein [Herbaspirillum sp. C9C3]UWE14529.1 hypothetical protein NY669_15560 [Herbaspirillum huttiense]
MKPSIDLDFSGRRDPLEKLGYGLFVLVLLLAVFEGRVYMRAAKELSSWQQTAMQFKQKAQQMRMPQKAALSAAQRQQLEVELKGASRLIARLSQPWDDLFVQIEAASVADATLLGIEPDRERGEIRLTAESKNMDAMMAYIRSLSTLSMLGNVYLVNHQTQIQDSLRPVRFVVAAKWIVLPLPQVDRDIKEAR